MIKFCKNCGSPSLLKEVQTFRDKTKHIKVTCRECDAFQGYEKQHSGFDRLIVKDFEFKEKADSEDLGESVRTNLMEFEENIIGKKVTIIAKIR